ncbi:hypothetical protein Tco_1363666 [Tanacetum coccineum]
MYHPHPHDSPLTGGYTPGSDEGRLKLKELMALCTKLSKYVLDLKKEKDAQAMEILSLKKRVKRLEGKRKSSISHSRRRIYRQVESFDDDLDEEDASKQGRNKDKIADQVSTARPEVSAASVPTLIKMKEQKSKEKGIAITDVEYFSRPIRPIRSITTLQPLPTIDLKDKDKGLLVEEESKKPKKVKRGLAQIESDAELAQKLHKEELAELERRERERERLQQEEREQFTIEERAKFLVETIEAQRKFRVAQRAAEIRSKPPTKSQLRNIMITYLKNMVEPESEDKSTGGSRKKTVAKKRIGAKLNQESVKRQKLKDVTEKEEAEYEKEKEELSSHSVYGWYTYGNQYASREEVPFDQGITGEDAELVVRS